MAVAEREGDQAGPVELGEARRAGVLLPELAFELVGRGVALRAEALHRAGVRARVGVELFAVAGELRELGLQRLSVLEHFVAIAGRARREAGREAGELLGLPALGGGLGLRALAALDDALVALVALAALGAQPLAQVERRAGLGQGLREPFQSLFELGVRGVREAVCGGVSDDLALGLGERVARRAGRFALGVDH